MRSSEKLWRAVLATLLVVALVIPMAANAAPASSGKDSGPWWIVEPEPESPSTSYDSILYSEIAPKLREIEQSSNRVKVEVVGKSAGGRDLYFVTLSAPEAMGRLGRYKAIAQTMLKDPAKAQDMIEQLGDFKVPVFINGSIHGNEYPGTDAAIRLIETLAYDDSEEVRAILDNVILLVNVVQNPDGRVLGTRSNANGVDVNRDFFTQSQPEAQITAGLLAEWSPMVVLDLHGFVKPMLIEPCTPPHNPNYEYDLYIKWALAQAEAMEAELFARTGWAAQIPYRDRAGGWDDWAPSYMPVFASYHGSYGHTLETPYRDERGVDAHYHAVWGALKFIAENRQEMVHDQVEIYRRGYLDLEQQPVPPELLPVYDQFPELMLQDFPAAYVIPAGTPLQASAHQPYRLIEFLLHNGVEVEKAVQAFSLGGVIYPAGTYVIWMDQPKRALANVLLEDGLDLSGVPGMVFYSPPAAWSNPLLWDVTRAIMDDPIPLRTTPVKKADVPGPSVESGKAAAYVYLPTSNAAIRATNELLAQGLELIRVAGPFEDGGRSFGAGAVILPGDPALARKVAGGYGLDVYALGAVPDGAVPLKEQHIAVYADTGTRLALDALGFEYDEVSIDAINADALADYDVFINLGLRWSSINVDGRSAFQAWYAAGGNYIALPNRGRAIDFAVDAGIVDVSYGYTSGNGVVAVDYDPHDPVAAGYLQSGHAFMYRSVWFTEYDGLEVSAWLEEGDFFKSGYWPEWQMSGAAGMPLIVHGNDGASNLTLIGADATFRTHPEGSFRLIANAIYNGLD
ncbi:MAG: M14 family zinc carboxypeptidase [Anaerosomatales bacterium]|nr:M14 family zinc carboxypeptidase [Anaerosomatales bacterium]MDT8433791.1 M14 family zinc carboxypeptidase [Anaerosomatales bacterium]